MTTPAETEAKRLHRMLQELYREGGFQKTAIAALWARIEKTEAAIVKEKTSGS